MTASLTLSDPNALTPVQWSARLAAYTSRGRSHDDPAVIACREALSYWRCRRVLDAEAAHIGTTGVDSLIAVLRGPHNTELEAKR